MLQSTSLSFPALRSAVEERTTTYCDRFPESNGVIEQSPDHDQLTIKHNKKDCGKACVTKLLGTKSKKTNISEQEDDQKPPGLSYIALISMAIQSCPEQRLLLSEIYQWIADRHPFYQLKDKSWRNSIRHNLSLNECFVKSGRSENGKGNYWSIHPANIEDFSKGDYRRRRARRRVRKCDEDLQRLCSNSPETPPSSPPVDIDYNGYVPMVSTLVPSNFLSALGVDTTRSRDEWSSSGHNPYQQMNYDYTFRDQSLSYCHDYRRHYSSNKTALPNYGHYVSPNEFVTPTTTTTIPNESTFNVNVNVNVCGNTSTGSLQQYVSPDNITTAHQSHYPTSCLQSLPPEMWQDLPSCYQIK